MKATTTALAAVTAALFLAAAPARSQEIQERKENQQDRIAQGVKSGELRRR
jgi:hypothetical protein